MQIYVDFDGVILDTDAVLDSEFKKVNNLSRSDFVQNYDWEKLVNSSLVINNSLEYLSNTKYETYILSKISSMKEGIAKIKYLREHNVLVNIHLVPTKISKSDVVNPLGSILIDDKIYNLDEWSKKGGISIFFNKDNLDTDIKGIKNTKYPQINNLSILISNNLNDLEK
jgi:hypothetical protein